MGKNKTLLIVSILFFCCTCCFAKQVSFQIVQHDNRCDKIAEQSYVVEDKLLNDFFEYGYIVTNSDASVSSSEDEDQNLLCTGIKEAIEGYSDYFIQVKLYYELIGGSQLVCLRRINWVITNVLTGSTVTSKSFTVEKEYLTNDELIKLTSQLGADINKSLKA